MSADHGIESWQWYGSATVAAAGAVVGPGGSVAVTGVGVSGTTATVSFARQTAGVYTLTLQPTAADTFGLQLDRDADGRPADTFTATASTVAARSLAVAASVVDGAPLTATVRRTGPTAAPLTVALASTAVGQLRVPATVVIPAGQTSAAFAVVVVNDTSVERPETVRRTAAAAGLTGAEAAVGVTDDDRPTLTLALPASAVEGGAPVVATVTRDKVTDRPLVVKLRSGDVSEATVPATVVIPAGQASATFLVTAVNDAAVGGPATVTLTANGSYTDCGCTILDGAGRRRARRGAVHHRHADARRPPGRAADGPAVGVAGRGNEPAGDGDLRRRADDAHGPRGRAGRRRGHRGEDGDDRRGRRRAGRGGRGAGRVRRFRAGPGARGGVGVRAGDRAHGRPGVGRLPGDEPRPRHRRRRLDRRRLPLRLTAGREPGAAAAAGGAFAVAVELGRPGAHLLRVRVTNFAGNSADTTLTVFADLTPPAVEAVTGPPPAPQPDPVAELLVRFVEDIDPATVAASGFALTRSGGPDLLAGVTVTLVDARTVKVAGLAARTADPCVYRFVVRPGGVAGVAGNAVGSDVVATWANRPAPTATDTTPPTSRVEALPAESDPAFTARRSGEDAGGVAGFDVLVSTDGGAFLPWLTDTTLTAAAFAGQVGRRYAFYTRARDLAGNVEAAPPAADAETTTPAAGTATGGAAPPSPASPAGPCSSTATGTAPPTPASRRPWRRRTGHTGSTASGREWGRSASSPPTGGGGPRPPSP